MKKILAGLILIPSMSFATLTSDFIYNLYEKDDTFSKAYVYGVMDAYEHTGKACFNITQDNADETINLVMAEFIRSVTLHPELKNEPASSVIYDVAIKKNFSCN